MNCVVVQVFLDPADVAAIVELTHALAERRVLAADEMVRPVQGREAPDIEPAKNGNVALHRKAL